VAGIQVVKPAPGSRTRDGAAHQRGLFPPKGLLMFAPVGWAASASRSSAADHPEDALRESIAVFEEAVDEVLRREAGGDGRAG
jgi:hypothetical protein